MAVQIRISTRNVDYTGIDPLPEHMPIKDPRLIQIFWNRVTRPSEYNPMAQTTLAPQEATEASGDEGP